MIELSVKHTFSAGHRIPRLPGAGAKCANLHGHTFGVEWVFTVERLDASELEFAEAKKLLRGWVDEHLDHGYLVAPADEPLIGFLQENGWKFYEVQPFPTTEAIAKLLHQRANELIRVPCNRVTVTEGPHNSATVIG